MGTGLVGPRPNRGAAVRAPRRARAGIGGVHERVRLPAARDRWPAPGGGGSSRPRRADRDGLEVGLRAMALPPGARWSVGGGGRGRDAGGGRLSQSPVSVPAVADARGTHPPSLPGGLPVRALRAARALVSRLAGAAAVAALALLAGACATPPPERYLLQADSASDR